MRFFRVGLLSIALVVVPAIPEYPARGEPFEDSAFKADLVERGYRNARLPSELLVEVESNNRKRCFLEKEAAEAWESMLVHAEHDGVRIEATSCYRDRQAQTESYNWNCPITSVSVRRTVTTSDDGQVVKKVATAYASRRVCRVPTARPGNSNHGWGRAIDVTSRGWLLSCRSEPSAGCSRTHTSTAGWTRGGHSAVARSRNRGIGSGPARLSSRRPFQCSTMPGNSRRAMSWG